MVSNKEIFILTGSGHKGIVKLQRGQNQENMIDGSCSLDFRPSGAVLYLVGDKIAKVALKDINTTFQVPIYANNILGCVVRSNAVNMFGGSLSKKEILDRIDADNRQKDVKEDVRERDDDVAKNKNSTSVNVASTQCASANKHNINTPQNVVACNESATQLQCDDEWQTAGNVGVEETMAEVVIEDANNAQSNMQGDMNAQDDDSTHSRLNTQNTANTHSRNEMPNNAYGESVKSKMGGDAHTQTESARTIKEMGEWVKYNGNNFYYAVKPQIDELFVCYPEDAQLNELVANSKWVRVESEDGYYVVGLLFVDREVSHICYGVPASPNTLPPKELESLCVWLPVDDNFGYWTIYQSAKTGEIDRTNT